jgi:hypothetical protein
MADYITEGGQRTKYTGFDEGFIINISAAAGKKKGSETKHGPTAAADGRPKKKKSNKKETHTICWWRIRVGGDQTVSSIPAPSLSIENGRE